MLRLLHRIFTYQVYVVLAIGLCHFLTILVSIDGR